MNDLTLARLLGWASFVIAGTEAFTPHVVEDELGIADHSTLMRALALREAAAGATILSQKAITPTLAAGLWSRVAGDAMDLALLGMAAGKTRNPRGLAASTLMVVGVTALDVWAAWRVQQRVAEALKPTPAKSSRGKKGRPSRNDGQATRHA